MIARPIRVETFGDPVAHNHGLNVTCSRRLRLSDLDLAALLDYCFASPPGMNTRLPAPDYPTKLMTSPKLEWD